MVIEADYPLTIHSYFIEGILYELLGLAVGLCDKEGMDSFVRHLIQLYKKLEEEIEHGKQRRKWEEKEVREGRPLDE
jgi:hypothetical protein